MSLAFFLKVSLLWTELWNSWDCKELNSNRISLPLPFPPQLPPVCLLPPRHHSLRCLLNTQPLYVHMTEREKIEVLIWSMILPSSPRSLLFVLSLTYMHKHNLSDILSFCNLLNTGLPVHTGRPLIMCLYLCSSPPTPQNTCTDSELTRMDRVAKREMLPEFSWTKYCSKLFCDSYRYNGTEFPKECLDINLLKPHVWWKEKNS